MATFAAMIDHVIRDRRILSLLEKRRFGEYPYSFTSDNGACYEWGPLGFDQSSRKGFTQLPRENKGVWPGTVICGHGPVEQCP